MENFDFGLLVAI